MKRFEKYFVKSRKRHVVYRRYVVFYYLRYCKDMTLSEIGKASGFDHATVIHGLKQFDNMMKMNDKEFFRITKDIGRNLLPEIYYNTVKIDYDLRKIVNLKLNQFGVDASDKYAICGKVGERTFTVDGFHQFINDIIQAR